MTSQSVPGNTSTYGEKHATVVQVMENLGQNRGGLTKAVLDRFRLISEGRRSILVTVGYQLNVESLFNELKVDGQIPEHTELLNFHSELRKRRRPLVGKIESPQSDWENGGIFRCADEPMKTGSLRRYFRQGVFVGTIVRGAKGLLTYVDKHNESHPWIREYRDVCSHLGQVVRRDYFDENGVVRFRIYVDNSGSPFLSVWVNENNYEYRVIEHANDETIHHGDMRAANAAWLKSKLSEIGPAVVYADEPRTSFTLSIDLDNIFLVAPIHTTHYKNNRDTSDGLKPWMTPYLTSLGNVGKFVFFTETQRQDFVIDTGCEVSQTDVIPHPAPVRAGVETSAATVRNDSLFVTISRLGKDKRIEHSIEAFKTVHEQFPDARLKIFGDGPEKQNLLSAIQSLGLTNVVTLEGHTKDPLASFSSATCSILTSNYEGFGLVLTESFACATPVIAYDVIYGPHDIIDSGQNGILVENGSIADLATTICNYLRDKDLQQILRKGAMNSAKKYTPASWESGWLRQFEAGASTTG